MTHFRLLLGLLLTVFNGTAQVFPVQVGIELRPPYTPYLTDYTAAESQNLMIQILMKDLSATDYRCKLRVTIEGVGILIRSKPAYVFRPIVLNGATGPQLLIGSDLSEYFHPDALDFYGVASGNTQRPRLPDGVYRFSVEVLDYNRGTVVSNRATATAWIMLNDPPMLTQPINHARISLQDPPNILFTWTPRHTGSPNAAFNTTYTFRLVELWPENRNPYDAFLAQEPLYEVTTTATHTLYGTAEPQLLPGRKYAWQVEARDQGGRDLFRNQGRSEVFVFQFGEALTIPDNLRMRWAKPTTLAIQWDAIKAKEDVRYRLQYRVRRRSEDREWHETWTRFTDKTLYQLQTNTEYEMRIRSETALQESEYSESRFFKTLREEEGEFVCRDDTEPPPLPENTLPVFPLSINDTIDAGGYSVVVRDLMRDGSRYHGSGLAIVPWMNSAKVRVTFEKIAVNDRFRLTSGTIKSVWDGNSGSLIEQQVPVAPGHAPEAGEIDITVIAVDSLIAIQGAAIASVTKDEEGNTVVITTDGAQQVIPKGESAAVTDETGNGYVVTGNGDVAKTTATEARAAADRGARSYELSIEFAKGQSRYGLDEKKYPELAHYYQQLDNGTYIAWKALSSAAPDELEAIARSSAVKVADIAFEFGGATVPAIAEGNTARLRLQGRAGGVEEELVALYGRTDTIPREVVGKINLVTYDPIHYNLEIVPVNGARLPEGLHAGRIQDGLNRIYGQAVVSWNVAVKENLQVELGDRFDDGDAGLFANYTGDMKKVIDAFGPMQDNAWYLFIVETPRDASTLGYMPRSRRAGFVFSGPHQGNANEFLKTIAHELGHGAFDLKHTFNEHTLPAGTSDNLMDYSDGTALYKYQWDHIHEQRSVIRLWEGGEEREMDSKFLYVQRQFQEKYGSQVEKGACWNRGVSRAYSLYEKFDIDVAMYAGFLHFLLCETEIENCNNTNSLTPFSCGLLNGLIQQIDWITMAESLGELSLDVEKLLICIKDAYSIRSNLSENKDLENVLFRCLTGIEMGDLIDTVTEFILDNWTEPYYQGQATAFSLSLLGPLRTQIIARLKNLPKFSNQIEKLKLLANTLKKEEFKRVVRLISKKVDDTELDMLAATIKFQPGPQLPERIAKTFTNSHYVNRKLVTSERFFKYHGIDNRTGKEYTWLANKKYETESQVRAGLAIKEDWKVQLRFVSELEVPKGTWVSEGTAASQGVGYPGGEYQAVILNVPEEWIIETTQAF